MNNSDKDDVQSQLEKTFLPPVASPHKTDAVHQFIIDGQGVYHDGQQVYIQDSKKSLQHTRRVNEAINLQDLTSHSLQLNDQFNNIIGDQINNEGSTDLPIITSQNDSDSIPTYDHDLSELRATIIADNFIETSSDNAIFDQTASLKDVFATPTKVIPKDKDFLRHRQQRMSPVKFESLLQGHMGQTVVTMATGSKSDKRTCQNISVSMSDVMSDPQYVPSNMRSGGSVQYSLAGHTSLSDTLHSTPCFVVPHNRPFHGGKIAKKTEPKEEFSVDSIDKIRSSNSERLIMSDDSMFAGSSSNVDSSQNLNFITDANMLSQLGDLTSDSNREGRLRQVDMFLSELGGTDESDLQLANMNGDITSGLHRVVYEALPNSLGDPLSLPSDFLDNNTVLPKTSPNQLQTLLPNLSTTTDLALSFSSQFLENSNASIDMGSFSGSETSFNAPHNLDIESFNKKNLPSELNFTNALKGVTEKGKNDVFITPRKRKSSEVSAENTKPLDVKNDKVSLVEHVSCLRCVVCEFLTLYKEDMANHMKTRHNQDLEESNKKHDVPNEPVKKELDTPSASEATIKTRRPRKENIKIEKDPKEDSFLNDSFHMEEPELVASKKKRTRAQSVRQPETDEYRCRENGCSLKLKKAENMEYHQKCHVGSFLACPECQIKLTPWSILATHLWKAHGVDIELHKCTLCPYKAYSYTKMMNNHWKTHGEERNYVCGECTKRFKTAKQLRRHKAMHTTKKVAERFNCEMCSRTFSDKRMLHIHLDVVHKKVKPYLCSFCGKSFASNSTLSLHTRKHTGEKPFSCETCEYRTADHNSMRRHRMQHSNVKRYSCPYCGYSSIQSSTYKVHLKRNHEEAATRDGVLYCCSQCAFKTVKRDNYLSHMGTHHQISEEEQNRVANIQLENINKQPNKRVMHKSTQEDTPSIALKQEASATSEETQQTYYVLEVPHVVNIGVNDNGMEDATQSADVLNGIFIQGNRSLSDQVIMGSVEHFDATILQQVDSGNGMVQLTPEVVAVPITSSIPSNGGFIYVAGDVDSIGVNEVKETE